MSAGRQPIFLSLCKVSTRDFDMQVSIEALEGLERKNDGSNSVRASQRSGGKKAEGPE